jgi:hypothetical protein
MRYPSSLQRLTETERRNEGECVQFNALNIIVIIIIIIIIITTTTTTTKNQKRLLLWRFLRSVLSSFWWRHGLPHFQPKEYDYSEVYFKIQIVPLSRHTPSWL